MQNGNEQGERNRRNDFRIDDGNTVYSGKQAACVLFRVEDTNGADRSKDSGKESYDQSKQNRLQNDAQWFVFKVEKVFVVRQAKARPSRLNHIAFVEAVDRKEDDGEIDEEQNQTDKAPF